MTQKQRDAHRKTRSHVLKDLPLRDSNAAKVTGGRDPATGLPTGKRQNGAIEFNSEPPIVPSK